MSLYQEFIDGKVQLNACRVSPYALESFTVLGDKKSLSHTEVAFARLVDGRGRGVPVAIKAGKNIAQVLQRWPAITTEYTIQEEIDAYMGLLYEVTMYEYISKYVLAPRLALNFIGFIGQGRCRGVIDPRSKTAGRAPVDQNPAYTRWIDLVDRKAFTQVANLQSVGAVYAKLDEDSQRQRQGLLKALAIEQKLQDAYQQAKEIAEREDRSAQEAARGLENVRDREGGDFLQDLRDEAKHEELVQQARQRNALARQALFRANRDFQDNQQLIAQLKAELEALVAPRREQVGESFVELNQLAEDVASAETNVLITYKPDNIEKLVDWWNSVATRNSEAADEVMAQIFYNLHVMERLEILHGDLHTGNVFVQTLARPVTLELGAGQVKLTVSTRYIVYFYDWDWGFKDVLGPNLRFRDPGYCSEFRNCNKFIRLYDMFILLSALDFPMEYARGIATPSTLSQVLRQAIHLDDGKIGFLASLKQFKEAVASQTGTMLQFRVSRSQMARLLSIGEMTEYVGDAEEIGLTAYLTPERDAVTSVRIHGHRYRLNSDDPANFSPLECLASLPAFRRFHGWRASEGDHRYSIKSERGEARRISNALSANGMGHPSRTLYGSAIVSYLGDAGKQVKLERARRVDEAN